MDKVFIHIASNRFSIRYYLIVLLSIASLQFRPLLVKKRFRKVFFFILPKKLFIKAFLLVKFSCLWEHDDLLF